MRKSMRFAFALNVALKLALISAIAVGALSSNAISGGQTAGGLLTLALERLSTTNDPKKLTDLSRAIQKFIVDLKHKKEMQTEAGKDLAAVQVKLANYFALKAKFNACIADKAARLKLDARITDTYLKMPTLKNIPLCGSAAGQLIQSQATIEQIVVKLKQQYDVASGGNALELRDDLILQGYKDALKTYLDLNHRYKRSDGKYDGRTVRQIICELFDNASACTPGTFHVSRLDSATYFTLQKYGDNYQAQLQKITPLTTEQVRQKLNANISVIEKAYNKVPPRPTTGHLFQGEGFSESDWQEYKNKGGANAWVADQLAINAKKTAARDEQIQIYNQWYREYLGGMTRYPSGSLVFTEAIGKYFKAPMDYNTDEETKFERIPSAKTVDSAVGEAMSELKKYGHFLSDRDLVKTFGYGKLSTGEIKKHVQDIVRNAPASAAQVLVAHPEYAPLMCEAINAVNADVAKKDADDADTTKFYLWGGAIVAGCAITGGVGAAVFAGSAAGALFATATTASFIAGTALGAGSAVYYYNKASDSYREFSELKSAFISTGAKDLDAWPEMKKSFEEFEEARFQFALQMGFSAIDAASFASVIRGFNSAQKMTAIAKAHEFLEVGRFNPIRNSRMLSIVNKLGEEEASKFFTVLSQMGKDQKYIDEFLAKASKLSKPDLASLAKKMTADLESEKGRTAAMIEMEEFKPSGPVVEVTAFKPKSGTLPGRFKSEDPYEILGVTASTSKEEAENQLRRLKIKFYPGDAASPEEKLLRQKIRAKLDEAYDKIYAPKVPETAFAENPNLVKNPKEGITVMPATNTANAIEPKFSTDLQITKTNRTRLMVKISFDDRLKKIFDEYKGADTERLLQHLSVMPDETQAKALQRLKTEGFDPDEMIRLVKRRDCFALKAPPSCFKELNDEIVKTADSWKPPTNLTRDNVVKTKTDGTIVLQDASKEASSLNKVAARLGDYRKGAVQIVIDERKLGDAGARYSPYYEEVILGGAAKRKGYAKNALHEYRHYKSDMDFKNLSKDSPYQIWISVDDQVETGMKLRQSLIKQEKYAYEYDQMSADELPGYSKSLNHAITGRRDLETLFKTKGEVPLKSLGEFIEHLEPEAKLLESLSSHTANATEAAVIKLDEILKTGSKKELEDLYSNIVKNMKAVQSKKSGVSRELFRARITTEEGYVIEVPFQSKTMSTEPRKFLEYLRDKVATLNASAKEIKAETASFNGYYAKILSKGTVTEPEYREMTKRLSNITSTAKKYDSGLPVSSSAKAEAKTVLSTEELEALDTHDNPVWKAGEWRNEFSAFLKHKPDADLIENEADILRTDARYSIWERKQLQSTKQTIHEDPGEYATITMIQTEKNTDAFRKQKYLTEQERQQYKIVFKNGKACSSDGKPLDTRGFQTGQDKGVDHAIFVMDKHGNIFVSKTKALDDEKNVRMMHSTLAGGDEVAMAGEVKIIDGKIVGINNESGHYKPPARLTLQVFQQLRKEGMDVSGIVLGLSAK